MRQRAQALLGPFHLGEVMVEVVADGSDATGLIRKRSSAELLWLGADDCFARGAAMPGSSEPAVVQANCDSARICWTADSEQT